MARGRMMDRRISKSKKLAKLKTDKARLLYHMIYPHVDSSGRYSGDPLDIKEDCVPRLKYPVKKIVECLLDLDDVELITLYAIKGIAYFQIERFEDFQTIRKDATGKPTREATSIIPPYGKRTPALLQQYSRSTALLSLSLRLSLRKEGRKEDKQIYFSFEEAGWKNIKEEHIKGWKQAYPACDIIIELYKMREWLLANPDRAKSNYRRFIVNWLTSQQDKGGTKGIDKQRFSGIKEWYEGELKKGTHETK